MFLTECVLVHVATIPRTMACGIVLFLPTQDCFTFPFILLVPTRILFYRHIYVYRKEISAHTQVITCSFPRRISHVTFPAHTHKKVSLATHDSYFRGYRLVWLWSRMYMHDSILASAGDHKVDNGSFRCTRDLHATVIWLNGVSSLSSISRFSIHEMIIFLLYVGDNICIISLMWYCYYVLFETWARTHIHLCFLPKWHTNTIQF